jgi:hypothetical protein
MRSVNRFVDKKIIAIFFVLCFLGGFLIISINHQPRVKLGDEYIYCNPGAKVKPDREYQLRLWDTNWPVLAAGEYKAYLEKLVQDFQKIYPNIKVQITLIDFGNGLNQLAVALKNNSAPDVYCSAFSIPAFDRKRQIPVGFYLKQKEKEAYFPEARRLVSRYRVECCFPRWMASTVWLGNQHLFNSLNLPLLRMQKTGYSWEEFMVSSQKLPKGKFMMVGNLGYNGFFTNLAVNASAEAGPDGNFLPQKGVAETLNQMNSFITERKIPSDFEPNMLGRFLAGDSLILAGVRPIIYRFLKLKLAEKPEECRCEPVLLPSPGTGRKKFLLTENGVICIYRNKWNTGDDQIAAAVKLGKFISTYEKTGPFQEMMLIPAAQKSARRWCKELFPTVGDVSGLLDQVENSSLLNLPDYSGYQREIYPVLQEFFARKTPLESVKERLQNVRWK